MMTERSEEGENGGGRTEKGEIGGGGSQESIRWHRSMHADADI